MNYPTYFGNQPQNGQQFPQNGGMPQRPDMQNYQQQQEQMRQQMMMQQAQMQNVGQKQPIPQYGLSPSSCIVSSREEAAAVTADFTGSIMIFPDIAHNKIYVKQWDNGLGSAVFNEYVPFIPANTQNQQQEQQQDGGPKYALAQNVQDLYDMVDDLMKEVDKLKEHNGQNRRGNVEK